MIYINEWLANPVGKDSDPSASSGRVGEFVEIFNNGKVSVNLSGWYLKTKVATKTKFVLSGEVGGGGFAVFKKPEFKITLGNTDGELFLYDASGKLVDHEQFLSLAPEGKSYARISEGDFLWTDPTAGMPNKFLERGALIDNTYPISVPLNKSLGIFDFILLALGAAAVLTGLIIFILKKNENLSKLFFRGDEANWR